MKKKRPYIITVIGDLYIFGAFLLILSIFPFLGQSGIVVYSLAYFLKVPILLKNLLIIINAIILLIISYGYLKLKLWGYWSMICFYIFSLAGWIISYQQNKQQFFTQNIIMIIIGIIFTLPTIKDFKMSNLHNDNL